MIFIDDSGNYPRHIGDVLLVKPDWNARKKLPNGWERVYETEPPRRYLGNVAVENYPVRMEDNKLYQSWTLVKAPDVDIDISEIIPQK